MIKRLLVFIALFASLLGAGLLYVNYRVLEQAYADRLEQSVRAESLLQTGALKKALQSHDKARIRSVLDRLSREPWIAGVSLRTDASPEKTEVSAGGNVLTYVELPVEGTGAVLSAGVDASALGVWKKQYLTFASYLFAGYVALVLMLVWIAGRAFGPLRRLAEHLETFDPSRPVPLPVTRLPRNEAGTIVEAVNAMSEYLASHAERIAELQGRIDDAERHLKEAQQIARMGSWQFDIETQTAQFSDQMYVLAGIDSTAGTMQWNDLLDVIDIKDRRFFERAVTNTAKNGTPFRLMHKLHNRDGEVLHILTEGKRGEDRQGRAIVTGISLDVTEQNESQRMVERLAFYDPLTNLPNRLLFGDRLEKALKDAHRRREKVGVFFLDLDHFKHVNDTLGHTMGDMLLKEVAHRLRGCLRESDTVSRIGGDEFVVIAPMLHGEADALVVAKKLLNAMQEKWELGDKALFTTTSIGIAMYPDHAEDVDTLVKFADTAMYRAKEEGRNKIKLYSGSMGEKIEKVIRIEHEMRIAIETMEQFELYYQPKISLRSGAIAGAEVLIRWNHPSMGLVFPDDFIPIAENTGMIIAIGEWVMHEAARQVERWKKEGIAPLRLAVNLSGRQFQSPTLLEHIRDVLGGYDIAPQYLEFEVTESVSMNNMDESLKVLDRLRDFGVGVVIDDFGTGYSSLAYLKQFPVDTLKIDKAFIMNMLEDADDRTIVESIVSMSKAMNLKIVAEGVETAEHVTLLKKMGVDFAQGYYFSRPIPLPQFDLLYRKNLVRMQQRRQEKARGDTSA